MMEHATGIDLAYHHVIKFKLPTTLQYLLSFDRHLSTSYITWPQSLFPVIVDHSTFWS